jgi:hypothetical protein
MYRYKLSLPPPPPPPEWLLKRVEEEKAKGRFSAGPWLEAYLTADRCIWDYNGYRYAGSWGPDPIPTDATPGEYIIETCNYLRNFRVTFRWVFTYMVPVDRKEYDFSLSTGVKMDEASSKTVHVSYKMESDEAKTI